MSSASIVIRTVGNRPREIRRAITSIANNSWGPVEVVIVYQGKEGDEWDDLLKLQSEHQNIFIKLVRNNKKGDRRAENLNIGWRESKGKYIGFLDDDDTLEPEHLKLLINAIELTGRSWAYSQVVLRHEDEDLNILKESLPFRKKNFSLKSLWVENFIPIHSILINREALKNELCNDPFFEELDRSEDWDFLLRLAFYHEPAIVEEFTANYHISIGSRNTNISLFDPGMNYHSNNANKEAWSRCKSIVELRKKNLVESLWWSKEYFDLDQGQYKAEKYIDLPTKYLKLIIRKLINLFKKSI